MNRLAFACIGLGITLLAVLFFTEPKAASADHNIYLPYAGQTWLAQQIRATQEQVWCLEPTAAAYPNFRAQLIDVNDRYTELVGIKHREVAWGDPSCAVRHRMDAFPCGSGAAACIYYGNRPVDVFYNRFLGFTDFRSAQGHELGHGILGQLHERYVDSGGRIQCGGPEQGQTVMDCGSPYVRYPTPLDVSRGCAVIQTSWCGQAPEPPSCEGPTDERWGGTWNPCAQVPGTQRFGMWEHPDGRAFDPTTGFWYFRGELVFDACDTRWNGRHSPYMRTWQRVGTPVFFDEWGYWWDYPPCG